LRWINVPPASSCFREAADSGVMGQAFTIPTFNAAKIAAFALIAPRDDS
jgi:hypothetical protein